MKTIALILLTCAQVLSQPSLVWTQGPTQAVTGFTGYNPIQFDQISGTGILFTDVGSTIYSSNLVTLSLSNRLPTNILGNGDNLDECHFDTPTMPGSRHPAQQAMDTKRGVLWMWGGVNQLCTPSWNVTNGSGAVVNAIGGGGAPFLAEWIGTIVTISGSSYTITAVADAQHLTVSPNVTASTGSYTVLFASPNTSPRSDMYYATMNQNPLLDTWTQTATSLPAGLQAVQAIGVYDSDDDIIIDYGGFAPGFSVYPGRYCSTIGNPTPGTLSPPQVAGGCVTADIWTIDTTASGGAPSGSYFPGAAYSPILKKVVIYGGANGANSVSYNETWTYDVPTRTLTQRCTSPCTPPPTDNAGTSSMHTAFVYDSRRGTFIYHHFGNTNPAATSDWELIIGSTPSADTWTQITSSGSPSDGPYSSNGTAMAYDPITDQLWAFSSDPGGNGKFYWTAQLSDTGPVSAQVIGQESLFNGDQTGHLNQSGGGVNRADEVVCMGYPIADSAGITSVQNLSLAGWGAAQFRILGSWPSGNIKWAKGCAVDPGMLAGGSSLSVLSNSGQGSATVGTTSTGGGYGYGGANLASIAGSTITVNTGAATFTVKAGGNFNVLDTVTIGATTVVATSSSATRGLILMGPAHGSMPGEVTCSPQTGGTACTTVYSSANDSGSSCAIEENGPVRAVIRCIGNHMDGSGNSYMQYTMRETFDVGKTYMRALVVLRNANYNTAATPSVDCNFSAGTCLGGTFNIAHKGLASYEMRIGPNISGTINYSFATDTTPQTGTVSGTDQVWIYQGQSNWMVPTAAPDTEYCQPGTSYCANLFTTDMGYNSQKNSTVLASGSVAATIGGWMDCANSSNVGIEIGIEQMASAWPASLECDGGGLDIRIGLFSQRNSQNVYMPFTGWKEFEAYMVFHTSTPSSLNNTFLSLQAPLIARPNLNYLNSPGISGNGGIFPYPFIDGGTEDNYYQTTQAAASPALTLANFCFNSTTPCTPDRGQQNNLGQLGKGFTTGIYRYYGVGQGGSLNQEEFRWGDMLKFLQRGFSGRWLNSKYFYRWQAEIHIPHHDGNNSTDPTVNGFNWYNRDIGVEIETVAGEPLPLYDTASNLGLQFGWANSGGAAPQWRDYLHDHWYGMTDFYFLTGDETVKEAINPYKDWYLSTNTSVYGLTSNNTMGSTRAYGAMFLGAGRAAKYLAAIGDTTGNVLTTAEHNFANYVNTQPCEGGYVSGVYTSYPSGCTPPPLSPDIGTDIYGTSRERGNHSAGRESAWCPSPDNNQATLAGNITAASTSITTSDPDNEFGWGYEVTFDGSTYTATTVGTSATIVVGGNHSVKANETALFVRITGGTNFIPGIYRVSSVNVGANTWTFSTPVTTGAASGMTGYSRYVTPANLGSETINFCDFSGTYPNFTMITGTSACPNVDGRGVSGTTASSASTGAVLYSNSAGLPGNYRLMQTFIDSILAEGELTLADAELSLNPTYIYYNRLRDYAYGLSAHAFNELFLNNGINQWTDSTGVYNGFLYDRSIDFAAKCPPQTGTLDTRLINASGTLYDQNGIANGSQGIYFHFWALNQITGDTSWQQKFQIAMQRGSTATSAWLGDWGMYSIDNNIWALSNPPATVLQEVPFTVATGGSTPCGSVASGSYCLSFTPPSGTCTAKGCLRLKWSPLSIEKTIGSSDQLLQFDSLNNQSFGISPNTFAPWFGTITAEESGSTIPTPTPGSAMNVTVVATTGLSTAANSGNFSVKASAPQGAPSITSIMSGLAKASGVTKHE